MDEYISREATVKAFCEKCKGYYDGHCVHRGECDVDVIQTAPAADVQPVNRGRWETWGYVFHGIEWERCSVCGKTADISYIALLEGRIKPVTPSFCGCCGARMDGDAE